MTLLEFAAERRAAVHARGAAAAGRPPLSIDISRTPGPQLQDGTERQTDRRIVT